MMMTSTFPTSKSNSRSIKNGLKEIQVKKENLNTLEAALKKRINEFRELCLKEGELTGHLPADYPLQPREPIPQVRRRVTRSSGNIAEQFSASSTIMPPPMMAQHRLIQRPNGQVTAMTLPSTISQPPSRPTSTNSSSSASSTYRQQRAPMGVQPSLINNNYSNSSTSIMQQQQQQQQQQQKQQQLHKLTQHYQPHKQLNTHHALPNHFKTPYNLTATTTTTNPNFDIDSLGHMRASSTASSSSSSGSAASSTASAFASIPYNNYRLNDPSNMNSHALTSQHPVRPPRGLTHASSQSGALKPSAMLTTQLSEKQTSEGNINGLSVNGSPAARHFAVKATVEEPPKLSDLTNGVAKFQPYYEETKPFQMSDFYKYSSKHRQKGATTETGSPINDQVKTTRQLQEDVSRSKNSLRYNACDDQIQQSVNLIEKSGQKLIEATAKAIAGNPSLAERLNNILPNHHYRNGESY